MHIYIMYTGELRHRAVLEGTRDRVLQAARQARDCSPQHSRMVRLLLALQLALLPIEYFKQHGKHVTVRLSTPEW